MSMLAGNSVLATVISISFVFWIIPFTVILIGMFTRSMFAWSFDKVIPTKFASISERFHTPVLATIITLIAGIASLFVIVFVPGTYAAFTMVVIGILIFTFIPVALTAIIFPYRKRDLFANSPVSRYKLGGIPLITIAGTIMLVYVLWMLYVLLKYPTLGGTSLGATASVVGVWVAGLILFYIAKVIRTRRAINLDLVYKEIPPE